MCRVHITQAFSCLTRCSPCVQLAEAEELEAAIAAEREEAEALRAQMGHLESQTAAQVGAGADASLALLRSIPSLQHFGIARKFGGHGCCTWRGSLASMA